MRIWTLKQLQDSLPMACINDKWVPARPINWKYRSLRERITESWAVFRGRAEAFTWPENQ